MKKEIYKSDFSEERIYSDGTTVKIKYKLKVESNNGKISIPVFAKNQACKQENLGSVGGLWIPESRFSQIMDSYYEMRSIDEWN